MARSSIPRPSPRTPTRRLPVTAIALEGAGFLAIACTIWLDEVFDLPHYLFGAPVTQFRPHEAMVESGLVLLLGAVIVIFTARLVRTHLDRLIVLCAWCHRVRLGTAWVSVEEFLLVHRAETSHGICAECTARIDSEIAGAA